MDTLADIRVALNAARDRIECGLVHHDAQQLLDDLWSRVYEPAPADLQPYVWSRLVDLAQHVNGVGAVHALPAARQPPASHYRP